MLTDHRPEGLAQRNGVHSVRTDDSGQVHLEVDTRDLDDLMRHLASFGIRSLVSQPPTLEEPFLREYGQKVAADELEESA